MKRLRLKDYLLPGQSCHVAATRIDPAGPLRLHRHDFCELFWVERGAGTHHVNGQRRNLRRGLLTLIRPDDAHTLAAASTGQPLHIVNVAFATAFWRRTWKRCCPDRRDLFANPVERREYFLSEARLGELHHVSAELRSSPLPSRIALERFLLNLLFLVESADTPPEPLAPQWVHRAACELRDAANFVAGTAQVAGKVGRSPEHLSRAMRKYFNRTPTELLNEARMDHAAARLIGGDEEILDIVLECGFENVSHFYRLFRSRFGLSPRRYRLRQRHLVQPHH